MQQTPVDLPVADQGPKENASPPGNRWSARAARAILFLLILVAAFFYMSRYYAGRSSEIKRYTFVVREIMVQVTEDKWATMWSYNGQVPGPTIRAKVGDTIEITLVNKTNQTHSVHSHGFDFAAKDDGSMASPESLVPPGGRYTYTFKVKRAGFFFYHCHSEDDQPVSVHTQMGLYGAVIVEDPDQPLPKADKEEVIFFGEVYPQANLAMAHGCSYCTFDEKYFTIDARTYPKTREFHPIKAKVGERVRFRVVNIGNDIHSFHLHRQPQNLIERTAEGGVIEKRVEAQVVGLVPGEVATIDTIMEEPGTWLFHCHVVSHADKGMVSQIEVEP